MGKLYDKLKDYSNWAIGITISCALFLLAKDKFLKIFNKDKVLGICCMMLLAVTLLRYFIYLRSGRHELDIIDSSFEVDDVEDPKGPVVSIIIAISIIFGILIAYSTNLFVYSIVFYLLSICDLYGQGIVNLNVGLLLIKEFKKKNNRMNNRKKAMFYYFHEKPLLLHAASFIIVASISFILSIINKYEKENIYLYFGYLILILANIIGEVVIWKWRKERDEMYSNNNLDI